MGRNRGRGEGKNGVGPERYHEPGRSDWSMRNFKGSKKKRGGKKIREKTGKDRSLDLLGQEGEKRDNLFSVGSVTRYLP